MLASLVLTLALVAPHTHLEIQPWTGQDFVTTTGSAAKYRLLITGKPNSTVHLQAGRVADGWLGAFCTPTICSPQRLDVALPGSGKSVVQFELIREAQSAPHQSGARITGSDGAYVTVPVASR